MVLVTARERKAEKQGHMTKAAQANLDPRLANLREKIEYYNIAERRERYEGNLREFVEGAWSSIDSAPFIESWALDAMCLPYDAKIITSDGVKSIGDIVETKWMGNVLSFNHTTLRVEWQPILVHMKSAGKPMIKIKTSDVVLKLTGNHPVFTKERGYVRADQIEVGDVVSLHQLRGGIQSKSILKPVLREKMLSRRAIKKGASLACAKLQALWKTFLSAPVAANRWVLFPQMLRRIKKTSRDDNLPDLRWAQSVGGGCLQSLLGEVSPIGAIPSMHSLWKGCLEIARAVGTGSEDIRGILQPEMFWTFHKGGKSSSVCQRIKHPALSNGILYNSSKGEKTGKQLLFSLFKKIKARCASYRSGYEQQRDVKPCLSMSEVPSIAALSSNECANFEDSNKVSAAVVNSVEREIWIPDAVYNIEVSGNHNYFAEGILVHNCDHLEAVTLGHIPRLLLNVPPRCSKTTLVSIVYPAWTWARSDISFLSGPQVRFLCASYNHSLSLDSANKSRRLLFSPWFQQHWPGKIVMQSDQDSKGQYDNTSGGSRIATSVGGSLIGLGGDILIGDDLNNTEGVESEADRIKVATFWNEFHSTRLNDPKKSALIVVQQRLHENDVSGMILDSDEDWTHLMLPMRHDEQRHCVTVKLPQYDDDQPWEDPRTEEGELLWPQRFGEVEVRKLESALGPIMSSGRLQQAPSPKGGGIIRRDWWQPWDQEEAARYGLEWHGGLKEFPPFELVVGSLDTSYGEKQENDYNALTIWGIWIDKNRNRRAMLMFAWNKRLPLHGKMVSAMPGEAKVNFDQRQKESWGLVEWVADTCKRYRVRRLLIEDKTRGRDVANEINRLYARENWGVELVNPQGDKVARTHSIVPLFTDGCIWAPDTRWADAVIVQSMNFPKADHDDMHDTMTQFLNWARENGLLIRADEMNQALEDEAQYRAPAKSVAQAYGV